MLKEKVCLIYLLIFLSLCVGVENVSKSEKVIHGGLLVGNVPGKPFEVYAELITGPCIL